MSAAAFIFDFILCFKINSMSTEYSATMWSFVFFVFCISPFISFAFVRLLLFANWQRHFSVSIIKKYYTIFGARWNLFSCSKHGTDALWSTSTSTCTCSPNMHGLSFFSWLRCACLISAYSSSESSSGSGSVSSWFYYNSSWFLHGLIFNVSQFRWFLSSQF